MNDPHVVALNYRIEHRSSVDYDKASPLDHTEEAFGVHVEGDTARFVMKRHCATKSEAIEVVEDFIQGWEFHAVLQNGPNEFRLVFDGAEIEDRDPTTGAVSVSAKPIGLVVSISEPVIHVSRGSFPLPPPTGVKLSREVQLMFDRYVRCRAGRELLINTANFCLTVLEKSVEGEKAPRKAAAKKYGFEFKVLDEVGRLCACKGGAEARKAQGVDQDLNGQERQFLEEVVKAIIMRAAEVARDPDLP